MRTLALIAICASIVGCSSDDGEANHANHAENAHNADNAHNAENANHAPNNAADAVDTYVDGLVKMGEGGHLQVSLMSAVPAPPDVGENTWTLRVLDMNEDPIDGAKVTVAPFMPAHGHGTSPSEFTGTFSEDGTYEVGPFDLFMPGVWETTVTVEGDETDVVSFSFELEG